jgi:class 3 adenylate cyclase
MTLPRRTFLHLAAGTAALPIASPVAMLGQGTTASTDAIRIVERTHYYAKTGLAAAVLDVRRKASAVRLSIGLPAGEIFVKHPGGDGSEPDVVWQCTFANVAARDADLAARAASVEFESVRVQMRKLYTRFERQVFSIAAL